MGEHHVQRPGLARCHRSALRWIALATFPKRLLIEAVTPWIQVGPGSRRGLTRVSEFVDDVAAGIHSDDGDLDDAVRAIQPGGLHVDHRDAVYPGEEGRELTAASADCTC
jgi:hypothetical protein